MLSPGAAVLDAAGGRAKPSMGRRRRCTIGSAFGELPFVKVHPAVTCGSRFLVGSVATGRRRTADGPVDPPLLVEQHLDVGHARQEEEPTRKDASGLDQQP